MIEGEEMDTSFTWAGEKQVKTLDGRQESDARSLLSLQLTEKLQDGFYLTFNGLMVVASARQSSLWRECKRDRSPWSVLSFGGFLVPKTFRV